MVRVRSACFRHPELTAWPRHPEISEALPMMGLWVGVYRKANTKWSPLLRQCEQRTRGAIRSSGRGIPGTGVALFLGRDQALAKKEAEFDQGPLFNSRAS